MKKKGSTVSLVSKIANMTMFSGSRSVSTLNASNRPAANGIPRSNVPINAPDEKLPMEFERNLFRNAVKDEASIARQRIAQDSTMNQQTMDQMLIKNATQWVKQKTQL